MRIFVKRNNYIKYNKIYGTQFKFNLNPNSFGTRGVNPRLHYHSKLIYQIF